MRRFRKDAPRQRAQNSDIQPRERYFTDGDNLYRFVEWLTPTGKVKLATVEDCRTLGLLLVGGDYLSQAGLRPVH